MLLLKIPGCNTLFTAKYLFSLSSIPVYPPTCTLNWELHFISHCTLESTIFMINGFKVHSLPYSWYSKLHRTKIGLSNFRARKFRICIFWSNNFFHIHWTLKLFTPLRHYSSVHAHASSKMFHLSYVISVKTDCKSGLHPKISNLGTEGHAKIPWSSFPLKMINLLSSQYLIFQLEMILYHNMYNKLNVPARDSSSFTSSVCISSACSQRRSQLQDKDFQHLPQP